MSTNPPPVAVGTSAISAGTPGTSSVSASSGQVEAFLGKGSKAVGTLSFTGPAEIDGTIEGEIQSKDRLTIGESAVINAKITGAEIIVKGTVNGDIIAHKKLSLRKPARITGNITANNLSIEEGVVFEGKCSMNMGTQGNLASQGAIGGSSTVVDARQSSKTAA
jgi:cytoskeletal protein CcmA (bactofilin family)